MFDVTLLFVTSGLPFNSLFESPLLLFLLLLLLFLSHYKKFKNYKKIKKKKIGGTNSFSFTVKFDWLDYV